MAPHESAPSATSRRHGDLGQRATIEVQDPDVGRAMYAAMQRQGLPSTISVDGLTVEYVWE